MTVLELIDPPTPSLLVPLADWLPDEVRQTVRPSHATCRCGRQIVRYQVFPLESDLNRYCYPCASSRPDR